MAFWANDSQSQYRIRQTDTLLPSAAVVRSRKPADSLLASCRSCFSKTSSRLLILLLFLPLSCDEDDSVDRRLGPDDMLTILFLGVLTKVMRREDWQHDISTRRLNRPWENTVTLVPIAASCVAIFSSSSARTTSQSDQRSPFSSQSHWEWHPVDRMPGSQINGSRTPR